MLINYFGGLFVPPGGNPLGGDCALVGRGEPGL